MGYCVGIALRRAVCRGNKGQTSVLDIETWNQVADSALCFAHGAKTRETIARGLANRLQVTAPAFPSTSLWGSWTWAEISALDAQMLSTVIAEHLLPYDLRNELAGQHMLVLHSARMSQDSEDRILWVSSYYHVQRVKPMSVSGPQTSEWTTYMQTLLERISHQVMFDAPAQKPCRPAQETGRPHQQTDPAAPEKRPVGRCTASCGGQRQLRA